jgi:hypothetical protein
MPSFAALLIPVRGRESETRVVPIAGPLLWRLHVKQAVQAIWDRHSAADLALAAVSITSVAAATTMIFR